MTSPLTQRLRETSGETVTLLEGSSFCSSDKAGDISPTLAQGLFFQDTRVLSMWQLRVDDDPVESLAVINGVPYRATFVGRSRPRPGHADSTLVVERRRYVGSGLREDILLRNLGGEAATCTLTIGVDADFADLFAVKEGRPRRRGQSRAVHDGNTVELSSRWRQHTRGVRITGEGASSAERLLSYQVVVPAKGTWQTTLQASPVVNGQEHSPVFPVDQPLEETLPARRATAWSQGGPRVHVDDDRLAATLKRSRQDLGALRIFDPALPGTVAVAAGAPWFMALFGRDSIIASLMASPLARELAVGTAQRLAHYQGQHVDPMTEEQPGRIPHELRYGVDSTLQLGGNVYYGTADATPLFVMLVGDLRRWGVEREQVSPLVPHADRALEWIEHFGDRDGDGFVEYARATDRGLFNQGWKDSWDGVTFADGQIPAPPIALCEVQGYVYAAYLARALLAEDSGDGATARRWRDRAADLKRRFNERFWLDERGWFALGLDGDKRPIDALASNMGHCLWTGIVDSDKAEAVARRLMSPELFTGWGVRTLASNMAAYNPMSYHNGSVWPHDNGIIAAGLMRYGFVEEAQRVACAVLDSAVSFGGRLPELLCGFQRDQYAEPIPYPTACSPQAWAAATPIHLLRVLLRATPCVPHGRFCLSPVLPERFGRVVLEDLLVDASLVRAEIQGQHYKVEGLPEGIDIVDEPCSCNGFWGDG